MKKSRATLPLSATRFERQLLAYSTIGAVMLATSASAEIVHITAVTGGTSAARVLPGDYGLTQFGINLPGGLHTNLYLSFLYVPGAANFRALNIYGQNNPKFLTNPATYGIKVAFGATVRSPSRFPATQRYPLVATHSVAGARTGVSHGTAFAPVGADAAVTGYVGFKFANAGNDYYGWLRLKLTDDAAGVLDSIQLVSVDGAYGAYNDVAGGAITAGQLYAPVPEPANVASGLGLLALGAAGVRELRRRRKSRAPSALIPPGSPS